MRKSNLPVPEIGLIAITRGMMGVGVGFLASSMLSPERRRKLGWPLVLVGALTTIPLVLDIVRRSIRCED